MPVEARDNQVAKTAALTASPGTVAPHRENPFERSKEFLTEVRGEMRKVSSPSRAEVQSTTLVVIFAVFLFAAFFYVVDTVLNFLLQAVLRWLGGA